MPQHCRDVQNETTGVTEIWIFVLQHCSELSGLIVVIHDKKTNCCLINVGKKMKSTFKNRLHTLGAYIHKKNLMVWHQHTLKLRVHLLEFS